MAINKRLIPKDCSDAFLVKGYYEKDPDACRALKVKLNKLFKKVYDGSYRNKKVVEELFQKEMEALLEKIENRRIYVNDEGNLIGPDEKPLKEDGLTSIISKKIDAFLVKGYYDNTPGLGDALGVRISNYYFDNYYGLFQVNTEDAIEIFQMTAKALLINIRIRRIYVNNNGDLVGSDNKPFSSAFTTYFMGIAKKMYQELKRKRNDGTDDDPESLPDIPKIIRSGLSAPYEKYIGYKSLGVENGAWFWFINGKSTNVKIERGNSKSKLTIQMPYIGDDMHWWIDTDEGEKELGALYNDILYDDKQITKLTRIAHCLSQMTCMCKHILTLDLYLGKSNDQIAAIKGYKDSNTVKSKKHDCLKTLKSMVSGVHC